ncbi:MAG: PadR family transcriptional regulator [Hamadaea sp.]|uniref:PadR family transcriptional regulator n=1 Tax=Hamadaea sp. TaxID=2024425 RepID=UPI0017CEB86A|nr:PadR family transcriptional regulator [Hamadaea sp.]NUR70036.1 PadR family transcriptional regulator [Hamadaea sp.]NUT19345.1 PadR family transcriptional regulator [Hamadaea sp.]
MSTLRYALLAALHAGPLTGYEIVQRMRRPIGYYWTAQQSQIYPELARMTADGLIDHDVAAGPGPHDRKIHRLTAAGRAELAQWLVQPPQRRPPKDELVLKTYALAAADREAMRALYRAEAQKHRRRLDDYLAQQAQAEAQGHDDPANPKFGAYATLRMGVAAERTMLDWCEWLVLRLER